jgi:hypothetical protein
MKRRELLRHLNNHGCELIREGGNHSLVAESSEKQALSDFKTFRDSGFIRAQDLQRSRYTVSIAIGQTPAYRFGRSAVERDTILYHDVACGVGYACLY